MPNDSLTLSGEDDKITGVKQQHGAGMPNDSLTLSGEDDTKSVSFPIAFVTKSMSGANRDFSITRASRGPVTPLTSVAFFIGSVLMALTSSAPFTLPAKLSNCPGNDEPLHRLSETRHGFFHRFRCLLEGCGQALSELLHGLEDIFDFLADRRELFHYFVAVPTGDWSQA